MATNKAKTSIPKTTAPGAAVSVEKSSITAAAASAAAAGAAGGVNPGTNSLEAQLAASTGNVAKPAAETSLAQPDSTATAIASETEKLSPSGVSEAGEADQQDQAGGSTRESSSTGETAEVQTPAVIARVRALSPRGFYRGGRFWPAEWTDVRDGELSPEQMAAVVKAPQIALQWVTNGERHD